MPVRLGALDPQVCDRLTPDAWLVFVAEDERPLTGLAGLLDWRLAGALTRLVLGGALTGSAGEQLLSVVGPRGPGLRVLAFGAGPLGKLTAEAFAGLARRAALAVQKAKFAHVAVGLPEQPKGPASARLVGEAFGPLEARVVLVGDLQELALALPDVAARS